MGDESGGGDTDGDQWTPHLTEEELRDLLSEHLTSRWCCYPTGALKSASLNRVCYAEAFVYTLISWYENHAVQDHFMPYLGGRIDGRLEGDPPETWDLKRPLPEAFSEAECFLTLPHSEEAFACPRCYGVGYAACRRCRRKGNVVCHGCRGSVDEASRCLVCSGRGSVRCPVCRGRAVGVECFECVGSGRLKRYQIVHVTWTVAVDYVVLNTTDLPSYKLTEADGYIVHRQVGTSVQLTGCPAVPVSLSLASEFLVGRHQLLASGQHQSGTRLLLQRHSLRRIPLCQCDFGWSEAASGGSTAAGRAGRHLRLFVYGLSRRVHLERSGKALLCGLRAALLDRTGGGSSHSRSLATATCCLL